MSNTSEFDGLAESLIACVGQATTPEELAAAQANITRVHELADQVDQQRRQDQIDAENAHVQRRLNAGDDIDRAANNFDGFGYGTSAAFDELHEVTRKNAAAAAERDDWLLKRQSPQLWQTLTGEQVRQADDPRNRGDGK